MSRRVNPDRRKGSRRAADKTLLWQEGSALIEELRMAARTRRAANAMMRVEPTQVERFPEWKAAEFINKLLAEFK